MERPDIKSIAYPMSVPRSRLVQWFLIMQKRIPSWSCIELSKYLSGWTHVRYTLRSGNARTPSAEASHWLPRDEARSLGRFGRHQQWRAAASSKQKESRAPRPEEQAARPISAKVRKRCKIFFSRWPVAYSPSITKITK